MYGGFEMMIYQILRTHGSQCIPMIKQISTDSWFAFSFATANACSDRSTAETFQEDLFAFKLIAIAPVPVPTSTTSQSFIRSPSKHSWTNSSVSGRGINVSLSLLNDDHKNPHTLRCIAGASVSKSRAIS